MKANVVIIGGGISGVSIAYNLAKKGMKNIIVFDDNYTKIDGNLNYNHSVFTNININSAGFSKIVFVSRVPFSCSFASINSWRRFER